MSPTIDYLPGFFYAAWLTIRITILVILLSWVFGLIIALGKRSRFWFLRAPCDFYVWFVRGTPAMLQIFAVYFGLPQFGLGMSPFVAGVLTLGLNGGAYIAEIIRGGLMAIPKGQYESPIALGLSNAQAMRRVILPQVVRIILPSIANEAVATLKNTSLLSVITVVELTFHAQLVIARTFDPFRFYILAAVFYLILTTLLTRLSAFFEARNAARS